MGTDNQPIETMETHDDVQLEEEYPEGGLEAWLVVFGAWCAMIPSMGLLNTIGVIQAWLSEHQLETYSESSVGWIVSVYSFFLYICGAQVGKLVQGRKAT